MPIGKNAIKRVENNGYSNVASSAPDMENSIVAEPALSEQKAAPAAAAETLPEAKMTSAEPAKRRRGRPVKEKPVKDETAAASPTAAAPKRRIAKAAEKKTATAAENTAAEAAETKTEKAAENKQAKPARTRKTAVKAAKNEKNGFERVELGGEMPYWLL